MSICWCRRRTERADGLHHHGAGGHAADVGLELDLRRDRVARYRHSADAGAGDAAYARGAGRARRGHGAVSERQGRTRHVRTCPRSPTGSTRRLKSKGLGSLKVDTAYGGDSFVIVDAAALGFAIRPDEARDLAEFGVRIIAAANAQLGFAHPENHDWRIFRSASSPGRSSARERRFTARTPWRSGPARSTARRPAPAARRGWRRCTPRVGCAPVTAMSPARSSARPFTAISRPTLGHRPAIVPVIAGQAWITGVHQHMLDPTDPWPQGYRLSDTWPRIRGNLSALRGSIDAKIANDFPLQRRGATHPRIWRSVQGRGRRRHFACVTFHPRAGSTTRFDYVREQHAADALDVISGREPIEGDCAGRKQSGHDARRIDGCFA